LIWDGKNKPSFRTTDPNDVKNSADVVLFQQINNLNENKAKAIFESLIVKDADYKAVLKALINGNSETFSPIIKQRLIEAQSTTQPPAKSLIKDFIKGKGT